MKTLEEYIAKLPLEEQEEIKKMTEQLIAEEEARRAKRRTQRRTRTKTQQQKGARIIAQP